ncbi:hypothetical protein FHS27_002084 [Rhodopirellula rubra]|uniref:6-hydroxymethylpterin diphosphokinase MptE-like domain-containing protein n=1 Tax=Aporhodopirellula rubra TaxID=980271 RepID=A0A7W5H5U3_9BACT|nr:6-hydroxymethylpterin diphosphokinase MptE-like protein [Aporhodopirellula rubra]MBB3206275.1 hypothetical protein [Aporhodopirellula rubra]
MIAWDDSTPKLRKLVYWYRLFRARAQFFDGYAIGRGGKRFPRLYKREGYQSRMTGLYNKFAGKRCFIVCNGPSLKGMDLSFLKDEITIGCNGIYKNFDEWGFHTDFLLFEDVEQFEIRSKDLETVRGPVKMAALYNSYAIKDRRDWIFFNSPRCNTPKHYYYWNGIFPQFSHDFASIAHLGSTVTYLMLQLAYFLGCTSVYVLGLDHSYGRLSDLFPPGKIPITEENIDLVKQCHFDPDYYRLGDVMGVPDVTRQEKAYALALAEFEADGRELINLTPDSCLSLFPKMSLEQLKLQ